MKLNRYLDEVNYNEDRGRIEIWTTERNGPHDSLFIYTLFVAEKSQ